MRIDEIETRRGPPVSQQPGFYMCFGQRFLEERVLVKIDLADRKVVRRPPVGVDLLQLLGAKRQSAGARLFLLGALFRFFTVQNCSRHNDLLPWINTQPSGLRIQDLDFCDRICSCAHSTIRSAVKPEFFFRSLSGADAPKELIPIAWQLVVSTPEVHRYSG